MDSVKKALLEKNFEKIINVGFCLVPYEDLSDIFGPDPMVYGTTKDERIFSFDGVDRLFKSQLEQMSNLKPGLERKRITTRVSAGGNSAFIVEENTLTLSSPGEVNSIFMRTSCVMEYMDSQWKLTHWHNSVPVDTENDHWHMEEWKREKEKLQKLVDQQTADLQLKNRELEIEAATQRVRVVAMGMQESDDIMNVLHVMKEEFDTFELGNIATWIWTKDEDGLITQWDISEVIEEGNLVNFNLRFDINDINKNPEVNRHTKEWEKGKKYYALNWRGEKLQAVVDEVADIDPESGKMFQEAVDVGQIEDYWHAASPFSRGVVGLDFTTTPPEMTESILLKISSAFEMAYQRFKDLQKAEDQAREAKIETALEKVRSRTMGMQSSDELPEVANLLFLEVQSLGIPAWSCGYNILEEEKKSADAWMSSEGHIQDPFKLHLHGEASFDEMWNFVQSDKNMLVQEVSGEALQEHYKYMKTFPDLQPTFKKFEEQGLSLPTYQINHLCKFTHGFLMFITYEPVPEAHGIFKRFTRVFDQTYTRFLDLKKAEAQAKESQIELSLERIRSQVTAMQESSDLFDIVVKMRSEFISLGHEADYFWHMSWLPDVYEMSMTSEDGHRLGMVINIPKFVHDHIPGLAEWEKGNDPIYVLALDADDAWDYIENMNTHGHYEQFDPHAPTRDDIKSIGGLTFIIARTSHGEIGFSLPGEVPHPPQEALDTLVRFAGVFDLAYQRFEDLQESEQQARLILEERDRLEIALKELHATQDQLVQQEKLASLGQLTAGIAHEIKNPLNFVNNFSELSVELVEEAREEVKRQKAKVNLERRETGDGGPGSEKAKVKSEKESPFEGGKNDKVVQEDEAEPGYASNSVFLLEILNDIETNLKTIHKHGSRADSIVKSMLQHSRGGDGKMEPTPLNPLIKEYVNLAFHGMRAGKEPINVDIDLQLDDSVGEVPLVAEDFSRVILNLCNNAFDAMREKQGSRRKVQGAGGYEPKLTVRTKSEGSSVTIEIEDNGPGIPEEMKDKILQPFFTTKKGTAGTGLGLSITNDIVKAHGGSLNISSIPSEKTIIAIILGSKG